MFKLKLSADNIDESISDEEKDDAKIWLLFSYIYMSQSSNKWDYILIFGQLQCLLWTLNAGEHREKSHGKWERK